MRELRQGETSRGVKLPLHISCSMVNCMEEKVFRGRPIRIGTDKKSVGARITRLLRVLDLKAADVCKQLNFAANRFSQWQSGDRMIQVPEALELCFAYGITLDWLYRAHYEGMPYDLARKLKGLETT